VKRFWNHGDSGLEGELRRMRPEARDNFVASVMGRISGPRKAFSRARMGVAVVLTIVMVAALAPVGGATYLVRASSRVAAAAVHVVSAQSHTQRAAANSPASVQYKKKKKKKKKPPAKKARKGTKVRRGGPRFTG
jgi:hypothetical protein